MIETTGRDENDVRILGYELLKRHPRRVLPRDTKQILAARHLNQLRHPITRRHQRIDPFNASNRGSALERPGPRLDFLHPSLQVGHQPHPAVRHAEAGSHSRDIPPKISQGVWLQGNDLRFRLGEFSQCAFDIPKTDGAHLALRLRDDMCRRQLPQFFREDLIDAESTLGG